MCDSFLVVNSALAEDLSCLIEVLLIDELNWSKPLSFYNFYLWVFPDFMLILQSLKLFKESGW